MTTEPQPLVRPRLTRWSKVFIIVGVVLLACSGIILAIAIPAREAARRTSCNCHLKIIGLALHNYHSEYGTFPPAYVADAAGRPMHSWRVLILPFLEENDLYREYDFTEPWDGPKNRRLLGRRPAILSCPSHRSGDPTTTDYAAVFGPQSVFRGSKPVREKEISDGISNTLIVGEAVHANIPWTKPMDIDVTIHGAAQDPLGFSSVHSGGAYFLFADGHVRSLKNDLPPATRDALFTRAGNEAVSLDLD